jgi:hypothetical protein
MDMNREIRLEIDELVMDGIGDASLRDGLAGRPDPATAQAIIRAVSEAVKRAAPPIDPGMTG